MAELVDVLDLGSSEKIRESSSLSICIKKSIMRNGFILLKNSI